MDFCTISLQLPNVTAEFLEKNLTCYTQDTDHLELPQNIVRTVLLQLHAQTTTLCPSTVTYKTDTKNASVPSKQKDGNKGDVTGIKALASVTVAVAVVLAVLAGYLCLSRNKQSCSCKGEPGLSATDVPVTIGTANSLVKGERVTLRIPTPDNDSDTEVPYADIMITVRGVSTPELTQVGYLSTGEGKEWWGDESRCHLQASRSADRLHLPPPREISRKMSTTSEYAVITYA
ncbi:unnamed protein product [Tetraodon nigroviridis]|nr:unnamed protein product [Tetraodon nigroviridis]